MQTTGRRNIRYTKKGHGYTQPMNALAVVAAIPERRQQQRLSSIVLLRLQCSDTCSLRDCYVLSKLCVKLHYVLSRAICSGVIRNPSWETLEGCCYPDQVWICWC
uniref:Uncharacterized protein n=1 Tax=Strigops habroptila TaxID=2489341 RepID=A0A672TN94_STRHB